MVNYPPDYCPYCGDELDTTRVDGRDRALCRSCDRIVWHNPVPAAGVAVVDRDRDPPAVLCVERAAPPGVGEWTIPGGHVEFDEQPREAASRELAEETGVSADPADLTILDAISLPPREGKQVVSIVYVVDRDSCTGDPAGGSDAAAARFWTVPAFDRSDETFRDDHYHRFTAAASGLE